MSEHWFEPLAEFLGPAYLRNAFTMGTTQEVDFLIDALDLAPGASILDAGCGPGRHALEFARRGFVVTGVDISAPFIALARAAASGEQLSNVRFEVGDIRNVSGAYDVVVCLCQGGFGLLGGPTAPTLDRVEHNGTDDERAFAAIAGAVRPGGRLALSAFSAYFALRHLEVGEQFDPRTGVNHEVATLRDNEGREAPFDLWTTCFTERELRQLARLHGLHPDHMHGVAPGKYTATAVSLDDPELLLLATRR